MNALLSDTMAWVAAVGLAVVATGFAVEFLGLPRAANLAAIAVMVAVPIVLAGGDRAGDIFGTAPRDLKAGAYSPVPLDVVLPAAARLRTRSGTGEHVIAQPERSPVARYEPSTRAPSRLDAASMTMADQANSAALPAPARDGNAPAGARSGPTDPHAGGRVSVLLLIAHAREARLRGEFDRLGATARNAAAQVDLLAGKVAVLEDAARGLDAAGQRERSELAAKSREIEALKAQLSVLRSGVGTLSSAAGDAARSTKSDTAGTSAVDKPMEGAAPPSGPANAAPPRAQVASASAAAHRAKLDASIATRAFVLRPLPGRELVKGESGSYYQIGLRDPSDGSRFTFDKGGFDLADSAAQLEASARAFSAAVIAPLPPGVAHRVFVEGFASKAQFIKPSQLQATEARFAKNSYLPRLAEGGYSGREQSQELKGDYGNDQLPVLRAAWVASQITKPLGSKPGILQGGIAAGAEALSFDLILFVRWP